MDEAANDALLELDKLREEYPDGVKAIEEWMIRWVASAGYKRLRKILVGRLK